MNVTPHSPLSTPRAQAGVVLLESLIAILIFSMGILAIIGLQAAMVKNTSNAKYRADASFIAQQRLAEIWVSPNNLGALADGVEKQIPDVLPNGTITVNQPVLCQFEVRVTWQLPGDPVEHNYTSVSQINGRLPLAAGAC